MDNTDVCEDDKALARKKRQAEIEKAVKIGTGLVTIATFFMNINSKRNARHIKI